MSIRENQKHKYQSFKPIRLVADDSESSLNSIPANAKVVTVSGVTNDANDFIYLPPLNDCNDGHEILIINGGSSNYELRTPASSAEEINSEDCDATKEYLMTNTELVKVIKIDSTIGWMAHGYTAIGAVATAVVPD